MKLKVYFKKLQKYDRNQPVYYTGTNPASLQVVQGMMPDNDWRDFTADAENLESLNLSWKEKGEVGKGASNIDKGSSDEVAFTNKAFLFIKEWLIDSVSAPLNGIEVKIEIDNGYFSGYVIKGDGLQHCDTDEGCSISVMLKQKDDIYSCIETTMITDNHSGMFSGSYQHPRFSYCNEFRPSWMVTVIWSLMLLQYVTNMIIMPIVVIILAVIIAIISLLALFSRKLKAEKKKLQESLKSILPKAYTEKYVREMVRLAGCGLEHPAPLLRDYVSNVCAKCGVDVNSRSFPIIFDEKSDYFNTAMLSAEVKKGIAEENTTDFWIDDNKPLQTLDMLLDDLKDVFNAKWFVKDGTLYFNRKDFDSVPGYVYDFIGADKDKIIEGICYSWNESKKPAYARGGYSVDGFDNLTSDTKGRFNDIVEFNKPINPMLEGEQSKMFNKFGAARFRMDGIYKDYISESLSYMWIVGATTMGISNIPLNTLKQRTEHSKGGLLMQNDTLTLPKLIIWDGASKRGAKAKAWHTFNREMPVPNPVYNTEGRPYTAVHAADVPYDDYYKENNRLINWPLAFDAQFSGNLYDRFHQIDDPRINPPMNKNFELKIALCLPELQRLGVLENSQNIAIGRKVKLNAGNYYKEGTIEEIELSFDPFDKLGRWIKIKGRV